MKHKIVTLVILGCFVYGNSPDKIVEENIKIKVVDNNTISPIKERGPAYSESMETDFVYWKIDSSKNGYGAFHESSSPLAYSYDIPSDGEFAGWVAVYRQSPSCVATSSGVDCPETAGFLGVAQSDPYGELWWVESRINTTYPEGQWYTGTTPGNHNLPTDGGAPQARYPSALIASSQNKATAVWNEYTLSTYGGGETGGVPFYSYDFFGLGMNSNFSGLQHVNEGCVNLDPPEVCDPPDLWQGNVQMIDGSDGQVRLVAVYTSWDDFHDYDNDGIVETYPLYKIQSLNITNGYMSVDAPELWQHDSLDSDGDGNCLWYECGSSTGTPDFHINNDGIGYMGNTSYTYDSDTEPPFLHTIFFRYTEDYGETWTGIGDGGYKNSGWYHLPDEELIELTDSLYTLWSLNPEEYPDKPWYPWAQCTDSLGVQYTCGDTINYSNDPDSADFFWTPSQFLYYKYDILTDQDGGLHFVVNNWPWVCKDIDVVDTDGTIKNGCDDHDGDGIADSLYWENRYGGAGMIDFYNPDPINNPRGWRATFIQDFSDTYSASWPTTAPMQLFYTWSDGSPAPEWFFYPNIAASYEEGSEVLWYGASNASVFSPILDADGDTVDFEPRDIDMFMSKSVNNGRSWTVPENITNTNIAIEYGMHLANIGTDSDIGVYCMIPNFNVETYSPAEGYYDYLNYVYIGKYVNDLESLSTDNSGEKSDIVPVQFVLQQNYPNPFNPVTKISYSIDRTSNVSLKLYNVRGGLVETLLSNRVQAGSHDYILDVSHLSSGVYFYTMTLNDVSETKKLILMK